MFSTSSCHGIASVAALVLNLNYYFLKLFISNNVLGFFWCLETLHILSLSNGKSFSPIFFNMNGSFGCWIPGGASTAKKCIFVWTHSKQRLESGCGCTKHRKG